MPTLVVGPGAAQERGFTLLWKLTSFRPGALHGSCWSDPVLTDTQCLQPVTKILGTGLWGSEAVPVCIKTTVLSLGLVPSLSHGVYQENQQGSSTVLGKDFFIFFYVLIGKGEKKRNIPPASSFPKWLQKPGLGLSEGRTWYLQPSLPCR